MYRLYRFGTFVLPDEMPKEDNSTALYSSAPFAISTGGAYDAFGTEQSYPIGSYTLKKKSTYHYSDTTVLKTYINSVRALVGQVKHLYRRWDNGTEEWVSARLLQIEASRVLENTQHIELEFEFEVYSPYWHGDYAGLWTFDSGKYFDAGYLFDSNANVVTLDTQRKAFTITTTGNAIMNDPVIRVIAGSADIKPDGAGTIALSIKNTTSENLSELVYEGTILSWKTLIINCGAYTVMNDGVDDEVNFSLGSTHVIDEWFRLAPGDNGIVVNIIGGSTDSVIDFGYFEGWK